jgi:membrane protease YdiL (CAAX protease family)
MQKACFQCSLAIEQTNIFCTHCGASQLAVDLKNPSQLWHKIQQVIIFYVLELVTCCLFTFCKPLQNVWGLTAFDTLTAFYTCYFLKINWVDVKKVLVWNNFSWLKLLMYSSIAVTGAVLVHYTVGWLNRSLHFQEESYYWFFAHHQNSTILMLFFTAVMPAIFEELAYRGYILQSLLALVGKKQAILITAILFAIIHLNFLSLLWLLPFALFIGNICVKEKTIWYGVVVHFLFNLTACLFELWEFKYQFLMYS